MRIRRRPYERRKPPLPLRLTERDRRILETLHAFDGMMSLRQLDRLFFSGRGGSWSRERLRALFDHGFVKMPDRADMHRVPLGETVYFLDVKGAATVAALYGLTEPAFVWRKKPRWSLLAHDLAVNDFRLDIMEACRQSPHSTLHTWVPEGEFRAHPDTIEYSLPDGSDRTRRIQPDGYFTLRGPSPRQPGVVEEYAFLLEIDMGTEHNPRFARDKVIPGTAYLNSQAYRERFGVAYGRWLVVTTGQRRLANLKAQTERAGGEGLFYFTTFAQATPEAVLAKPIWRLAGEERPVCILPGAIPGVSGW